MKRCDNRVRKMKPAVPVIAVLALCAMLAGCTGANVSALAGVVRIESFSESNVSAITVEQGTAADAIGLPDALTANVLVETEPAGEPDMGETDAAADETQTQAVEEQRDVPVTWECAEYDPDTAGEYVFTPVLLEGYPYDGELPAVTVTVRAAAEAVPSEPAEPSGENENTGESAEPQPSGTNSHAIAAFTNDPISIEVKRGTAVNDIALPQTLPAVNENGEAIEVPVTWENIVTDGGEYEYDPNDYEKGSAYGYGPWIFTAVVDAAYTYAGEPVTAVVTIPDCTEVESFCGITTDGLLMRFVIFEGETVNLPSEMSAFMADGGYKNVPVWWSGSYDADAVGTYTLEMHLGDGYTGSGARTEIVVIKDYDMQRGEAQ